MLPRSLRIRIGDVVTYEGMVYVVRRVFSDGPIILRGIPSFNKDAPDTSTFEVRYIDTEYRFKRITFLQI